MKNSPWNTTPAPQDGSPLVAVGRVIYSDEFSTTAESFVAAVQWGAPRFNVPDGWHFVRDEISVAQTLQDEVIIDYWLPYPANDEG